MCIYFVGVISLTSFYYNWMDWKPYNQTLWFLCPLTQVRTVSSTTPTKSTHMSNRRDFSPTSTRPWPVSLRAYCLGPSSKSDDSILVVLRPYHEHRDLIPTSVVILEYESKFIYVDVSMSWVRIEVYLYLYIQIFAYICIHMHLDVPNHL